MGVVCELAYPASAQYGVIDEAADEFVLIFAGDILDVILVEVYLFVHVAVVGGEALLAYRTQKFIFAMIHVLLLQLK